MIAETFYSFDTSSLLNGRRDLLPPTTFPGVWENIEEAIADGQVRAIDLVRDELSAMDDEAHRWTRSHPGLFVELEQDVQRAARMVLQEHRKLIGVGSGRSGADPFVVALAMARGGAVVTEEIPSRSLAKPKIPDVCKALGIRSMNLIGYVQEQGWVFTN